MYFPFLATQQVLIKFKKSNHHRSAHPQHGIDGLHGFIHNAKTTESSNYFTIFCMVYVFFFFFFYFVQLSEKCTNLTPAYLLRLLNEFYSIFANSHVERMVWHPYSRWLNELNCTCKSSDKLIKRYRNFNSQCHSIQRSNNIEQSKYKWQKKKKRRGKCHTKVNKDLSIFLCHCKSTMLFIIYT